MGQSVPHVRFIVEIQDRIQRITAITEVVIANAVTLAEFTARFRGLNVLHVVGILECFGSTVKGRTRRKCGRIEPRGLFPGVGLPRPRAGL